MGRRNGTKNRGVNVPERCECGAQLSSTERHRTDKALAVQLPVILRSVSDQNVESIADKNIINLWLQSGNSHLVIASSVHLFNKEFHGMFQR